MHVAELLLTRPVKFDLWLCIQRQITGDCQVVLVDGVGDGFRRLTAAGDIQFDAEITLGRSRIMAGGENETTNAAYVRNKQRSRRCG